MGRRAAFCSSKMKINGPASFSATGSMLFDQGWRSRPAGSRQAVGHLRNALPGKGRDSHRGAQMRAWRPERRNSGATRLTRLIAAASGTKVAGDVMATVGGLRQRDHGRAPDGLVYQSGWRVETEMDRLTSGLLNLSPKGLLAPGRQTTLEQVEDRLLRRPGRFPSF